MKSYLLGVLVTVGLTAIYVTGNAAEIPVAFLWFRTTVHQGLWEGGLFSAGALLMWLFSAAASLEAYYAARKRTKELTARIAELSDEKKSLLRALENIGALPRIAAEYPPAQAETPPAAVTDEEEEVKPRPGDGTGSSPIKKFLSSIFKRDAAREPAQPAEAEPGGTGGDGESVCEAAPPGPEDAEKVAEKETLPI